MGAREVGHDDFDAHVVGLPGVYISKPRILGCCGFCAAGGMSFVSFGTAEDPSRPTFFELVAAERLTPSLKAAVTYSLWV